MEHIDQKIFNIRYNEKLDRLEIGDKKKRLNILNLIFKNKCLVSAILAFVFFSWLNLLLIYKFYKIIELLG